MKCSISAYNQRETGEKRPLGRDPDRSWCHLHTSVKHFWAQSMAPWLSAAAYECAAAQSWDLWQISSLSFFFVGVHVCNQYVNTGCGALSFTLREECRLRLFENRIMRQTFGSKRNVNG